MKQVQDAVREAAMRRFAEQKLPDMPLFKQVGMQMVLFGAREPKLYQLLFMRQTGTSISGRPGTRPGCCSRHSDS